MNAYIPMENSTANKLWEISSSFLAVDEDDLAMAAIQKQIQQFAENVRALNYDGSNCTLMGESGGPDYNWNLPGSLLFSITVFTTIGMYLYQGDYTNTIVFHDHRMPMWYCKEHRGFLNEELIRPLAENKPFNWYQFGTS